MRSTTTKKSRSGWHWTKRGWQRDKPTRRASPTSKPAKKHKPRKPVVVVAPPKREKPAFDWRAPQIAQERLLLPAAPTPAADPAERASARPPRAAWGGKYDQLQPPKPEPG